MSKGIAYDGTPLQAGTEQQQHRLTGAHPQFSAVGLREMVVIDRKFVDEQGNRSRSYVEYTCRDMQTMEVLSGCRRMSLMGGVTNGDDDVLRPSTLTRTNSSTKITKQTPAINTDGDRVLVGFIEGARARPVIIGVLTHSFSAYGATAELGDRRFTTHNGTSLVIDKLGQYTITHKTGSTIKMLDNGDIQLLPASGQDVLLGSADANENLMLGVRTTQFLSDLIDALLQATYPTGVGPTGPMLPPSATTLSQLQASLSDLLSDMAFTQKEV